MTAVSADSFELEFDAWKPSLGDLTGAEYNIGVRYRCQPNWVANSPDGYQVTIGAKGSTSLYRTASSAGNVQTVFQIAVGAGMTFTTTDSLRIRIVVAGNDHSAAYRKNNGPWTVIYKVQDTQPGTPVSAPGSIAFVNAHGQSQFANVVMRTIPTATILNGPGPGPVVSLVPVVPTVPPFTPDAAASYLVQESGGHLLLEDGASGVLIEAPVAVSTTFHLVLESGGHVLLEDGRRDPCRARRRGFRGGRCWKLLPGWESAAPFFAGRWRRQVQTAGVVTGEMIQQSEWISGLELKPEERDMVVRFDTLWRVSSNSAVKLDNSIAPAIVFNPCAVAAAATCESARPR